MEDPALSDAPFTSVVPLYTGKNYAALRGAATIPAAITSDLNVAAADGTFPPGTAFALFSDRHHGTFEIQIVVRGLGNDFLFGLDGSLTPEAADLHRAITTIASGYNSITAADPCAGNKDSLYRLEVTLETDIERRQRCQRSAALRTLAALWATLALAAGIALVVSGRWQAVPAQLGAAALCSVLVPLGYASHMARRWTTSPATAYDSQEVQ